MTAKVSYSNYLSNILRVFFFFFLSMYVHVVINFFQKCTESCKLSECFINITIKYCGIKIPIDLGLQHPILFSCPWLVRCQYLSRNWYNGTVSKMCQYVTRKRLLYIFITNYTGSDIKPPDFNC